MIYWLVDFVWVGCVHVCDSMIYGFSMTSDYEDYDDYDNATSRKKKIASVPFVRGTVLSFKG